MDDVAVLRTGLGIDAEGKVDLNEFMTMCEDIASNQVKYSGHRGRIGSTCSARTRHVSCGLRLPRSLLIESGVRTVVAPPLDYSRYERVHA